MIINMYELTLRSDDGLKKVTTSASTREQAIKQVCDAMHAPESAIIQVITISNELKNAVTKKLEDSINYGFKVSRKNALANPVLYGYRYTQKDCKDAKIEYLMGLLIDKITQTNEMKEYIKMAMDELKQVKQELKEVKKTKIKAI